MDGTCLQLAAQWIFHLLIKIVYWDMYKETYLWIAEKIDNNIWR
jgi:hypothetical protein